MKTHKIITIKDNGTDKDFQINKLNALDAYDFFGDLMNIVLSSGNINSANIVQLLYNLSLSGEQVSGANNAEVEKISNTISESLPNEHVDITDKAETEKNITDIIIQFCTKYASILPLLGDLFLDCLKSITKEQRRYILTIVLEHSIFLNGKEKMKLSINDKMDNNINIYVESPLSILKLMYHFISYNLKFLLPVFTGTVPNSNNT